MNYGLNSGNKTSKTAADGLLPRAVDEQVSTAVDELV
jgi:hypothetical protein